MNRNTFTNVMTQIDDKYIDEITIKRADLRATEAATKPKLILRTLPIAAALAVIISAALAIFTLSNRTKDPIPSGDEPSVVPPVSDVGNTTEEEGSVTPPEDKYTNPYSGTRLEKPTVTPNLPFSNTVVDGATEITSSLSSDKPGETIPNGWGNININFLSYYLKNEKAYAKIWFGFFRNTINTEEPFYPKLRAYNVYSYNFNTKEFPYTELIINGRFQEFTKSFSIDDIDKLKMTKNYTGELNSEILELDFSRMKEGDEGVLLIYFGNYFYESDEYRNLDKLRIYYSVGKNGIGLSLWNIDFARENLYKCDQQHEVPEEQTYKRRY